MWGPWQAGLCLLPLTCLWIPAVTDAKRKRDFTGHKVIRIRARHPSHIHLLQALESNLKLKLDFWSEPIFSKATDIRVPPDSLTYFLDEINAVGMLHEVVIDNLQALIDHEMDDPAEEGVSRGAGGRSRRSTNTSLPTELSHGGAMPYLFYWLNIVGTYCHHHEINQWLYYAALAKPDIVRTVDIGVSFQGRNLRVIKIGSPTAENKPAIWLDAGIHGREWISPATAVFIIYTLVRGYGTTETATRLVDTFDWYILPVVNPDGYEYSMNVDRMWRKTRSVPWGLGRRRGPRGCRGVDPNRNFDYHWQSNCSDSYSACGATRPCSPGYAGDRPFSEPETVAMANFILSHKDRLKMYVTLHSYQQLWLTPWAFTQAQPADMDDLLRVASVATEALKGRHGTDYITGSPAAILYAVGGTSYDWAKGVAGVKYSYTVELPDKGRYGFLLPRQYIVPTGEETWDAISAAALEILSGMVD